MSEPVLRIGCKGESVKEAQELLDEKGFLNGPIDGVFGPGTQKAVRSFQRTTGDVVDGILGKRTWASLKSTEGVTWKLKEKDYELAARELECEVEVIKAISEVESAGDGFFEEGVPKILFERHWMRRKLEEYEMNTALDLGLNHRPDIVNRSTGGYIGGPSEWKRFNDAYGLHHDAAIESASWGRFQIMGFHWHKLGYEDPDEFMLMMKETEGDHLIAFVNFIQSDMKLWKAVQEKDWRNVAYIYNGPAYAVNSYDKRMEEAYRRLTN